MALWFRDVITEGTFLGDHTYLVQKGITMSVGLFILSEVFFFVSVFWGEILFPILAVVFYLGHILLIIRKGLCIKGIF